MHSPLLRFPGETRNIIWEHASSGEAELHQHSGRMPFPRKYDALPAFHLPRVCRQIYRETATLAYSLSNLTFPCHINCEDCVDDGIFEQWNLKANRDAITTIELNADFIKKYTWLYYNQSILRVTYPNLRCIYVSKSAVEYTVEKWEWTSIAEALGLLESKTLRQWRIIFEGMIKHIEGEDMKVIFRD